VIDIGLEFTKPARD